jgi:hypothetical protein
MLLAYKRFPKPVSKSSLKNRAALPFGKQAMVGRWGLGCRHSTGAPKRDLFPGDNLGAYIETATSCDFRFAIRRGISR